MIREDTVVDFANTMDDKNFHSLLQFLSSHYNNSTSLVSDEVYDDLVSDEVYDDLVTIYENKFGKRYDTVGAEPTGEKVTLPYYIGSLSKMKKQDEIESWCKAYPGPYVIEDKVDGLSLLYTKDHLYTRGKGTRGTDVSHLIPYLKLPKITEGIAVRGEVVLTKSAFAIIGEGFKNARNLASGIINSKKSFNPEFAKCLTFYAFKIVSENNDKLEDVSRLSVLGFTLPSPQTLETVTKSVLKNYYNNRRQNSAYEMDGLVVYHNAAIPYPVGDNPKHVIAFKTGSETGVTTVTNVMWEASKNKLLKPTVYYETINLSEADLNRATGHNARYIVSNRIGPGARILLTRSGDVIPKILSVIEPSIEDCNPDPDMYGEYVWDDNHTEYILLEDNDNVHKNRIKFFLSTIGVKHVAAQRALALVEAGIDDISKLLNATQEDLEPIIGKNVASQLLDAITTCLDGIALPKIMVASGFFPRVGERRMSSILEVYPNLLSLSGANDLVELIKSVNGLDTMAYGIAYQLPLFVAWMNMHPVIKPAVFVPKLVIESEDIGNGLANTTIVFSGFRDKLLEAYIYNHGGRVTSAVSKKTTMVVLHDLADAKGKAEKAVKLGLPVIGKDEFLATYVGDNTI